MLLGAEPKYALMELSIAVWIDPSDLRARRLLSAGLAAARLDPQALRNLEELERRDPEWTSDPELADLDRELRRRNGTAADVTTR
ncbi:MAG: hypothetical protein HYR73_04925 [Candidatus Eisenbacteria bacterium]|nr:hypothetical protein [Candidatus Eisenbacteria bacterium]